MIPKPIEKLIEAHKRVNEKTKFYRSLRPISVSRVASFAGSTYETVRNTVEMSDEHLYRRRAIRRILFRLNGLGNVDPVIIAEDLIKEIIWAKYTKNLPIPEVIIEYTAKVISKYQTLTGLYYNKKGLLLPNQYLHDLYDIASTEIERLIKPYEDKDAMINLQHFFLLPLGLVRNKNLPEKYESIQNYIAILRSLTKFDDPMIKFYMFSNAFPFWNNPKDSDYGVIVKKLEQTLIDIQQQLKYKLDNKTYKEYIRQSIPLKFLDTMIVENIEDAESILKDKSKRDEVLTATCNREYGAIRQKVTSTAVKMIIYIAITKMGIGVLEVLYELWMVQRGIYEHLHYIPLAINFLTPPVLMALISLNFNIPYKRNTFAIIEMVDRYMDPMHQKYVTKGLPRYRKRPGLYLLFKLVSDGAFLVFLIGGLFLMYHYLHFDIFGLGIFVMFLSLVSFGALRSRTVATDLIVVPIPRGPVAPLIDTFAIPIVSIGKQLSEGVSSLSPFPLLFDYFLESPIKGTIRIFEEWNNFVKDRRDEVV